MNGQRPIMDAGPALNFCAINKERLLISTLGPLSTPETVAEEILNKARIDSRFRPAEAVWKKLTPKWVKVLSDEVTPELAASTLTVLEHAAGSEHLPDRGAMRSVYDRMRALDDGLPPLQTTNLLSASLWNRRIQVARADSVAR